MLPGHVAIAPYLHHSTFAEGWVLTVSVSPAAFSLRADLLLDDGELYSMFLILRKDKQMCVISFESLNAGYTQVGFV